MTSLREFWKLLIKPFRKHETQKDDKDYQLERQDPTDLIQRKSDKVNIQVGVDFGTSTTKIMYSQIGKRLSRVISL